MIHQTLHQYHSLIRQSDTYANGKVCERFLRFGDVSDDWSVVGLMHCVDLVVEEYELRENLVGQPCNGASVMSGHLTGLQKQVLDKQPKALLVHGSVYV